VKQKELVAGLDIGTSHIRVIVGKHRADGTINIFGVGLSPSEGMKKGYVVDIEQTVASINRAIEEAERMADVNISSAFVGLVGLNVKLIKNRGVVAVNSDDREIKIHDLERALELAKVLSVPADKEIVEVIPQEYIVDGYDGIKDPVGMVGVRLEVDGTVVTVSSTYLQNLLRCVTRAGLEVEGIVLQSMANGEVTLTSDEKQLGAFIMDIGGGTTEISYFKNGNLQDISVLPIGGDHITNDLAVGLHTSYYAAENLKVEYGCALQEMADAEEKIEIITVGGKDTKKVSEKDLANFIGPRVQEILQFARDEMLRMEGSGRLSAGVVITGGVSLMEGFSKIAENIIGASVRIGEPNLVGVQSPIYTTVVGIVTYVLRHNLGGTVSMSPKKKASNPNNIFTRLWNKIQEWLAVIFE